MPRLSFSSLLPPTSALFLWALAASIVPAQDASMLASDSCRELAAFSVGQTIDGYQLVGAPNGLGAFAGAGDRARLLLNHELSAQDGSSYALLNGTMLTGARISYLEIARDECGATLHAARSAYERIYDRSGLLVSAAVQINENGAATDGLARLASGQAVAAGTFGFVDDIFFCGEKISTPDHPQGGSLWALDVNGRDLWALPGCGRGSWENATPLDTNDSSTVALLLGDNAANATSPLYLYIGQKNSLADNSFLDRNGLAVGQLYVWAADNGDATPQMFNGASASILRSGSFTALDAQAPAMAGMPGHDAAGFRDDATLRAAAGALGAFLFSRVGDLHTDPQDPSRAMFAAGGRGAVYPADNWGTVYLIDVDFGAVGGPTAVVEIVFDGDALASPDDGVRSPESLYWSSDGSMYTQESRLTDPLSLFGSISGDESSTWAFHPASGLTRMAEVDRSVVLPAGATDALAAALGAWDSVGLIEITSFLDTDPGERLLLTSVQAHGIQDGAIGGAASLVEGGQLVVLARSGTMICGNTPQTDAGWRCEPVFTVGDSVGGYTPPGKLDGLAAFPSSGGATKILANHELSDGSGYAYTLANGTTLEGARVSEFEVIRQGGVVTVLSAGLAYDAIYDRQGLIVTSAQQVNESTSSTDGLARFCSGMGVAAGTYGFVDDIFFTGEEVNSNNHPHGGTEWALDVQGRALWAVPEIGRGAWENATPLDTGDPTTIALLLGDDVGGAPLFLYVGEKNAVGDNSFLDRNGLAQGSVYIWRALNGDLSPQDYSGQGAVNAGEFILYAVRDISMAGLAGYDALGYKDDATIRSEADALGAFSFSRPEDVHTNPRNATQAVMASTGRGSSYPADAWGTVYIVDVDFSGPQILATLTILYDGDDATDPDFGLRSPDNLVWADDGFIYVQEDRAIGAFGASSGIEASIWQLHPDDGSATRIAVVDRSAVLPIGSTDPVPTSVGVWETSGILDVTSLFETEAGERLLIAAVQAHSIVDGLISAPLNLREGGQLVFLSKEATYPGSKEDFDLELLVNGDTDPGSAPDIHEVRAQDLVTLFVDSAQGAFDFEPVVIIAQDQPFASGFVQNNIFPDLWLLPSATPGPFVVINSIPTPFGPTNQLQPSGNSYAFLMGPTVPVGQNFMLQALALTNTADNGIFAASRGQEIRFVN